MTPPGAGGGPFVRESRSMRTTLDFAPGQAVPAAGIYGMYFLGEYTNRMQILGDGEFFPEHATGVSFRLHEAF